ncbi:hypothetical protein Syun_011765 [Stephania yunnanensis]|uniref:Uncharacterized protein n=1 Tax=Stephania yunnanensis TaxID=152371 RepID=A0AAP0K0D7_9MAGN
MTETYQKAIHDMRSTQDQSRPYTITGKEYGPHTRADAARKYRGGGVSTFMSTNIVNNVHADYQVSNINCFGRTLINFACVQTIINLGFYTGVWDELGYIIP